MTSPVGTVSSISTHRPPTPPPKETRYPLPPLPERSARRQATVDVGAEGYSNASSRIEKLEEENIALKAELKYNHDLSQLGERLSREVQGGVDALKDAIIGFRKAQKQADQDFIQRTSF